MRKATVILFALFISISATAAPNDATGRGDHGVFAGIVHFLKHLSHVFDMPQGNVPIP